MNEEIKEIKHRLQLLHAECNSKAREEDINYTLDYITNLQTIEQQYSAILSENAELENKITNLQQENERLKDKLNDITNISYKDYSVWATERHYLDILDEFANDIKYKIAPNLTDTYRDGIKSALKHTIKYVKDNYKQETLEDYKFRCEKAIEYINEAIENYDYFEDDIATDISEPSYDKYVNSNSLLNILQNGSENDDR